MPKGMKRWGGEAKWVEVLSINCEKHMNKERIIDWAGRKKLSSSVEGWGNNGIKDKFGRVFNGAITKLFTES